MLYYGAYKHLQKKYPPWQIEEVQHFFEKQLAATAIPFHHESLRYVKTDPYFPKKDKIASIYVIYKKSILALLSGRIEHIHGTDYAMLQKNDVIVPLDRIEDVFDFGLLVVLETDEGEHVSDCFISGGGKAADAMYQLVHFFAGLPKKTQGDFDVKDLQRYQQDIKAIKRFGFFEIE